MSRQARRSGRLAMALCRSATTTAAVTPSVSAIPGCAAPSPINGLGGPDGGATAAGGRAGGHAGGCAGTTPQGPITTTTTTTGPPNSGPSPGPSSCAISTPSVSAASRSSSLRPHRPHCLVDLDHHHHLSLSRPSPRPSPRSSSSSLNPSRPVLVGPRACFPILLSLSHGISPPITSSSSSRARCYHVRSSPPTTLESSRAHAVLHTSPTLTRRRLRRLVVMMGHSHSHGGHSHGHDNSYLVSANKNDPGVRITRIGLLSNLLMAIAKFVGGWAFNSKAMIADAWHSIADMASDILTLATVSWSIKPPSDRFPLGFGKVESLGSLGVSGMLLVGGAYMGWDSALSLFGHFNPEAAHHILEHVGGGHGHSHSHSHSDLGIPSVHAVWLAGGTIIVKEWLYHATMKIARQRKSSVLASNAVHHRVDSLTGIVTMVAIVGANAIENAAWLDPVGGLLISVMVIHAGFANTKSALYELVDQTIDAEVKGSVRTQAQGALANVSDGHEAELRDVSGVKSGQNYLVDLEMAVPGAWTVDDLTEVENAVRTQVGAKVRGVRRVRVRFVTKEGPVNPKFDEFVYTNLDADPEEHAHKHENGEGEKHDHKH